MYQYTIRAYNAQGQQVHEWRSGPIEEWAQVEAALDTRLSLGTYSIPEVARLFRGRTDDLSSLWLESADRAGVDGWVEVLP
jgi:hypothetical protein